MHTSGAIILYCNIIKTRSKTFLLYNFKFCKCVKNVALNRFDLFLSNYIYIFFYMFILIQLSDEDL